MRARIWCRKHKRWHSQHAALHCRTGACTTSKLAHGRTVGKAWCVFPARCPVAMGTR